MSDVRKGQYWRDSNGTFRVMAVAENYAMVRRHGCMPFVIQVKKFAELQRLYVAEKESK